MTFFAVGEAPTCALEELLPIAQVVVTIPPYAPPPPMSMDFVAVEINHFRPAIGATDYGVATAEMPTGAVTSLPVAAETYETIRASDVGYIPRPADLPGQVMYAPTLLSGWALDRIARVEPWANAGSASWGSLQLATSDGRYDAQYDYGTPDGRPIKILKGTKPYDAARGVHMNPQYSTLLPVFSGVGNGLWRKGENSIVIDLRDASYQGERPIQSSVYSGAGGYGGTADIQGKPIPFCRGGTSAYPIRNVSPVLIDPTNRIWQYNDAAGTVEALYERGGEVFIYAGDTTDLYTGSTASGEYRTDNSRGLFQLGATAAGEITADVTGAFPLAGFQTTAASIARYLLTETIAIDTQFIDLGSLIGLDAARPWIAGLYLTEATDAMTVVDICLRSINAVLAPSRSGVLRATLLQAPNTLTISASYDQNKIIKCTPRQMPSLLSPPPFRIRLAHTRCYTVQSSNSWAGVATDAQKQFVSEQWSYAVWQSATNLSTYRKQNDPPPVETYLLVASEAQQVVDELGVIFGTRRAMFDLEMPMYLASRHEIGEEVELSYPGQISPDTRALLMGDSIDSTRASYTQTVLI